jgi:hypothetical protein
MANKFGFKGDLYMLTFNCIVDSKGVPRQIVLYLKQKQDCKKEQNISK